MQIKVFERIERKFETEIASATLTGDTLRESLPLQPFVLQPVELVYDEEGIEHCVQTDKQCSAVRFTVKREGAYFLDVTLKDGKAFREHFDAAGFCDNGYIRVSKKDARYFEYSNGSPFFPIGINLAFPRRIPVSNKKEFGISGDIAFMGMRQYERWFKRCAQCGVNMARVWVGHEYFSPDTTDANVFEYAQFSKIDNESVYNDEEQRKEVENFIPMGRFGLPEDCVGAVLLLCGRGGDYITGADIAVDGGMSL